MSSQWQSETQPPTKMRSSCNACTAAKIGCSKERPTCARCKRRKDKCIYVPTRRAGRPALNKQKQQPQASTVVEAPSPAAILTPPASDTSLSSIQWPDEIVVATHPNTGTTFEDFTQPTGPNVSGPPLPTLLQTDGSTFDDDLFSLLAEDVMQVVGDVNSCDLSQSPAYFGSSSSGGGNMGVSMQNNDITQLVQHSPFSNTASLVTKSSTSSMTSALSSSRTSWFSSTLPRRDGSIPIGRDNMLSQSASPQELSGTESESCGCLSRSLRLLNQLTPARSTSSRPLASEPNTPPSELSFEGVISQNRTTMNALNNIMDCSCSGDPSLLMVLALVIMKTLGWYAACASAVTTPQEGMQNSDEATEVRQERPRRLSIQPPSPSTMQDYDLDGPDSDRVICQLVLSELYGVQRAVNKFPKYIQSWEKAASQPPASGGPIESLTQDLLFNGLPMHLAGSESLATMIERSLRQHLRKLSEAIQNKLSEV